ncbi:CPBP family intramembrane glutamic endopeptidase [Catenuloplanes atrovinosus]|uniref:Membrane protease YdiL (CAAX protease family) n=1 Tax=Catenuloplanes atrovinosus TaxID=137266 RepID=A0AAE3YQP1_9ACTN|nr:type II CAAX endopeptidase family protein [Catenuloplanes atrovinosus]MDR7276887.1 membrane protease YdiL (CAAX protease family) [Catenuloplanes atrovinosus]
MARSSWTVRLRFPLMLVGVFVILGVAQGTTAARQDDITWAVSAGFATAILAVVGYGLLSRWIERRRPTEVSVGGAVRWLIPGTVIGGGGFALVMLVIWQLGGWGTMTRGTWEGLAAMAGIMACVAVCEELLFRGVLLRIVAERFGGWVALLVSAPLFGVMHLINAGADPVGAIAITVTGGLLLGAAYLATRSLWLPIGIHFGLNAVQHAVFGVTTDADVLPDYSLYNTTLSGPELLTGGGNGPESSLVLILLLSVPTVALIWYAAATGRMRRVTAPSPQPVPARA